MEISSIKTIAKILNHSSTKEENVSHFSIDSRLVKKRGLFFAIKGEKVDGHQFLKEVANKGAIGAVVSQSYSGPDYGLELIKVEDVGASLHLLAKESFCSRKEKVIGITGSMGKTTTKEFLSTILSAKYQVAKTPGNYNTQLTFPLTILNLEGEYDVLVLEMGMSQKGQIKKLVEIAPPNIALLTRIAPAGTEDFKGGIEAIAESKAEIFSHPSTELGIISRQAAGHKNVLEGGAIPKRIYGWKGDFPDPTMDDFVMESVDGKLVIGDSPAISLPFVATHLCENFLAAAAASRILGLSWEEIGEKGRELKPFKRRFEKIEREGITFIQDCYNANPESMLAAFRNLPEGKGNVIGVFGAMPDLGASSSHFHERIGEHAKEIFDQLLCIGEDTKHLLKPFLSFGKKGEHFSDLKEIKKALFSLVKPGDVVLIKGGNGFRLWELLEE